MVLFPRFELHMGYLFKDNLFSFLILKKWFSIGFNQSGIAIPWRDLKVCRCGSRGTFVGTPRSQTTMIRPYYPYMQSTVLQDCTTRSAAGVFLRAKYSGTKENSVDFCFTAQPHVAHAPRKWNTVNACFWSFPRCENIHKSCKEQYEKKRRKEAFGRRVWRDPSHAKVL